MIAHYCTRTSYETTVCGIRVYTLARGCVFYWAPNAARLFFSVSPEVKHCPTCAEQCKADHVIEGLKETPWSSLLDEKARGF